MSKEIREPKDRNMSMNFDLIINFFVCDVGAAPEDYAQEAN